MLQPPTSSSAQFSNNNITFPQQLDVESDMLAWVSGDVDLWDTFILTGHEIRDFCDRGDFQTGADNDH